MTYGWAVTNQTCRSGDKEEFLVGYAAMPKRMVFCLGRVLVAFL